MLAASLLFGCSISSFLYRRQQRDTFQKPIFILTVTLAVLASLSVGITPNLVMLGVIPWALCLAMVVSVSVHWIVRRCSRRTRVLACLAGDKEAGLQPGL